MREIRIYQPGEYQPGMSYPLMAEAAHHVGVVLRLRVGDSITLFNGQNVEFHARIVAQTKKNIEVEILDEAVVDREPSANLHLIQSISKSERMEIVMQKAVELGAASITPVITEYCAVKLDKERLEKKIRQWQAIAINAAEQCGRNKVTPVNPAVNFPDFLHSCTSSVKLFAHPCAPGSWESLIIPQQSDVSIIVGPEGGFSDDEVDLAIKAGFTKVSLGLRVLRTETASIVALTLLQAKLGDI